MLANDPDLAITRISLDQAAYGVKIAKGNFDPVFSLEASKSRASIPIASAIGGSKSGRLTNEEFVFKPKISGNTPWWGSSLRRGPTAGSTA